MEISSNVQDNDILLLASCCKLCCHVDLSSLLKEGILKLEQNIIRKTLLGEMSQPCRITLTEEGITTLLISHFDLSPAWSE